MTHRQIESLMRELNITRDPRTMSWQIDVRNRTHISEEMLLHGDAKHALVLTFRNIRHDLDRFIADLEKKVIEYPQE